MSSLIKLPSLIKLNSEVDWTTMKLISGVLLLMLFCISTGYGLAIRFAKWRPPGTIPVNTTRFLRVVPKSIEKELASQPKPVTKVVNAYDDEDLAIVITKESDRLNAVSDNVDVIKSDNIKIHDDVAQLQIRITDLTNHLDVDEARYGTYIGVLS